MGVNGGMADYVTRDELNEKLTEELGKPRADFEDRMNGHSTEINKAITWWSQMKEQEVMTAREEGALAAEPVWVAVRESVARIAALSKEMRDERVKFYDELRREFEKLNQELATFSSSRDAFHSSRLQRVEVRTDRLEDRVFRDPDVKP